jgi:hypothetical protein
MLVPCATIEDIADSWNDFYEESSSTGCTLPTGQTALPNPIGGLSKIFSQIAGKLGPTPRLIPNGVS